MARERPREEADAERWLLDALDGVDVERHDDGSSPGMYDLKLSRDGRQFGACEVTLAADPARVELWRLLRNDSLWTIEGLNGGWVLHLEARCSVRTLRMALPGVLKSLEGAGVTSAGARSYMAEGPFDATLTLLGIASADQYPTGKPGIIALIPSVTAEECGGVVPVTGDALAAWLSTWISNAHQSDNLRKLWRSGCVETHLFILLGFLSPVPFPAFDVLLRDDGPLPVAAPDLPDGITHLWVAGLWSAGDVFSWNLAGGWSRSRKRWADPIT